MRGGGGARGRPRPDPPAGAAWPAHGGDPGAGASDAPENQLDGGGSGPCTSTNRAPRHPDPRTRIPTGPESPSRLRDLRAQVPAFVRNLVLRLSCGLGACWDFGLPGTLSLEPPESPSLACAFPKPSCSRAREGGPAGDGAQSWDCSCQRLIPYLCLGPFEAWPRPSSFLPALGEAQTGT